MAITHPILVGAAVEHLRASSIKELIVTNTVPVPVEKQLNGKVKVYDMAGREVAHGTLLPDQTTRIDLHNQSGVYVVSVISNKGVSNVKIVIR